MKLKINQIKTLQDAISNLDGYQKAIKIEGSDKLVWTPYYLSGKTRYAIAKNLRILTTKLDDFNKARDAMIREISGGKNVIEKSETDKIEKFVVRIDELADTEDDVDGLISFSLKELGLEEETDL